MTAALERRKREAHIAFSRADAAVAAGTITAEQRDLFLRKTYGTTQEREAIQAIEKEITRQREERLPGNSAALVTGLCVIMVLFFSALFWSTGGITGAAILEEVHDINTTYTGNASINLTLNQTTGILVAGTAQGAGNARITLHLDGQEFPIHTFSRGSITTDHAHLPKSWYEEGETVEYTAVNASSAYLMTADEAIPLGNQTAIGNLSAGNYTIKLIINDTGLSQEELPFQVVPAGTAAPAEEFSTCGDACHVNLTGEAQLRIAITGDASVTISTIVQSAYGNRAPQLAMPIQDISGTTVTIDLAAYFTDADSDELFYESSDNPGVQEELDGSLLTISGDPGTYEYVTYASDLRELTPSNPFTVTIIAAQPESNSSQGTANSTPGSSAANGTNGSGYETPAPGTCDDPDPNRRPLECLQGNDSTYFRPDDLFLENKQATAVGKFTPIGNLLIRGEVIERSAGAPAGNDYQLGYTDAAGDFVATVWIDSATGDLHLRGTLTEANGNIPIESGLSAIANRRGIVLALIDRSTGDLIIRGNVIPYRRSFE